MTPLEALKELQSRSLVTIEDGEPCDAELLDPMSRTEIDALEEALGAPLPASIRELMAYAGGVEVDCEELSWNGRAVGQDVPGAFACWLPVLDDGAGNSWNVDIDRQSGEWGPVYFASHDPPALVRQAGSLAEFIIQFADDACQAEREGNLYLVAERMVRKAWDTGGTLIDAATLRESADPVLRRAATSIEEGLICDMRRARMGDGFDATRFGARTIIARPGPEAVWTIQKPAGMKKWFRRRA